MAHHRYHPNPTFSLLAAGLILLVCLATSTTAGVSSLSSGVSREGRLAHPEYSLKLVFARASGAYLSGVQVEILDQNGNTVLKKKAKGPWLYVKLPTGIYRVVARRGRGYATAAVIDIDATRQKRVYLTWP